MRSKEQTEEIKKQSKTLCNNEWVSLKILKDESRKIGGYVYSTEIRCNGNIVSFLPYKFINNKLEFLFRCEATPCWDLDKICISSFTGGVDSDDSIEKTVIKELREESGYEIEKKDLIDFGKSYGSKSSDTIYHLFSMDLTNKTQTKELEIESELEKSSYCKWIDYDDIYTEDPLAYSILFRFLQYFSK